jgi:ParB-like chromosome segregation protein Spo0J
MRIKITAITVGPGRRKLVPSKVKDLVASITAIGLQTPITVRPGKQPGTYILVAGRHRLSAATQLRWIDIEANVLTDRLAAAMWEIAENLHRADLTGMQRNLLTGKWLKLWAQKNKRDPIFHPGGEKSRRGRGRPGVGISDAARELGIADQTARRAVRIATRLKPSAQKVATELGLENQTHILERAAQLETPAAQIALLRQYAARKTERKTTKTKIQAALDGTAPPATPQQVFDRLYWSLDAEMQSQMLAWLLSIDIEALVSEYRQFADALRQDRMALH